MNRLEPGSDSSKTLRAGMTDSIRDIVFETLKDFGGNEGVGGLEDPTVDTVLYGETGMLDSLALVSLIADLEAALDERLGVQVALADERAMSRRRSPFRTAGSIVEFVEEVVRSS